jgi:hypothetical protein
MFAHSCDSLTSFRFFLIILVAGQLFFGGRSGECGGQLLSMYSTHHPSSEFHLWTSSRLLHVTCDAMGKTISHATERKSMQQHMVPHPIPRLMRMATMQHMAAWIRG